MLDKFAIKNYRGFSSLLLPDLSKVNVFVGRNNAGKTSVLEAFYLFSENGSQDAFGKIAAKRGELLTDIGTDNFLPDVAHFFKGHSLKAKAEFELVNGTSALDVRLLPAQKYPYRIEADELHSSSLELVVSKRRVKGSKGSVRRMPITSEGGLWAGPYRRSLSTRVRPDDLGTCFISPDLLDYQFMVKMWNRIVMQGREPEIVTALQLLLPEVDAVQFLLTELSGYRFAPKSSAGIVIGLRGVEKRIPLGSLGDGMKRLLAIAMALTCSDSGYLFIDEIDTGFHYSVMADLWRLVLNVAKKRKTQIFASTHSLDCLRGLGDVCGGDKVAASSVAVYALHAGEPNAVRYSGGEIKTAVDNEIEVRS